MSRGWAVVVLAAALGCGQGRERPDILLVTVDTLRPDALGWVAGGNATPAMDALAAESVRFPAAVAPAPLTAPSHASMMTGRTPRRHGVRDNGHVLADSVPTLAERLRGEGYATGAFVSGHPLRALYGLDRGFDRYDDTIPSDAAAWRERPAVETTRAALAWIADRARGSEQPWFVWVHYYDAHDPYTPPGRLLRPGPRGAYDGEVALIDESVAALRAAVDRADAARPLMWILTADHGESLGAHGEDAHGFFVYDATVRVPLTVRWRGRLTPRRDPRPARLVDLAPTILALLEMPALRDADGVSLVPLLEGREQVVPPALVESQQPWLGFGWAPLTALIDGPWKLIEAPRPELYDLAADPNEDHDRAAAEPDRVAAMTAALSATRTTAALEPRTAGDPALVDRLRALGYVVQDGARPSDGVGGRVDPKDRVAEKRRLEDADAAALAGRVGDAMAGFEAVLAVDPDNPYGLLRSGTTLVRAGRPHEAIPRLERASARDPRNAEAVYALAEALTATGRDREAAARWEAVVQLQPRRALAWSNLGVVRFRLSDRAGAVTAFERAAALAPDDPIVRENLAALRRR